MQCVNRAEWAPVDRNNRHSQNPPCTVNKNTFSFKNCLRVSSLLLKIQPVRLRTLTGRFLCEVVSKQIKLVKTLNFQKVKLVLILYRSQWIGSEVPSHRLTSIKDDQSLGTLLIQWSSKFLPKKLVLENRMACEPAVLHGRTCRL